MVIFWLNNDKDSKSKYVSSGHILERVTCKGQRFPEPGDLAARDRQGYNRHWKATQMLWRRQWVDQTCFETQIQAINIRLASRRQLRETGGRLLSWNCNKWRPDANVLWSVPKLCVLFTPVILVILFASGRGNCTRWLLSSVSLVTTTPAYRQELKLYVKL